MSSHKPPKIAPGNKTPQRVSGLQFFSQPAPEKCRHHSALLVLLQAATNLLEEMCHLTAQSLTAMDTSEHFDVLKLLGEGSYGKVMLAVHRTRGGG